MSEKRPSSAFPRSNGGGLLSLCCGALMQTLWGEPERVQCLHCHEDAAIWTGMPEGWTPVAKESSRPGDAP